MKLPKMPKGLMSRIRKEEAKAARSKKIADKKRAIDAAKKKLEALRKKNRGY